MKTALTFGMLALSFMTACQHPESPAHSQHAQAPEKRSSETEIRQYITGEWICADASRGCWYPKLIIAADGTLTGVLASGKRELIGTWELFQTDLRVTPTSARFEEARRSGEHLNEWDYFPIIFADAHQLVMTPGISMAGRWRYTR